MVGRKGTERTSTFLHMLRGDTVLMIPVEIEFDENLTSSKLAGIFKAWRKRGRYHEVLALHRLALVQSLLVVLRKYSLVASFQIYYAFILIKIRENTAPKGNRGRG